MPKTYRQGDILLVRVGAETYGVDLMVDGRVEPERGRLILARGEVTGHHHSVACADAELVRSAGNPEAVYLAIMAPTPLEHQEHAAITLEPGWYKVTRQREYQPGELPRQVAD